MPCNSPCTGTSSIPRRDLDLRGTASAGRAPTKPDVELPFVVQGPWDDAIILPDPQSLIRRSGAAQPLLDAVRDRKARDAVRSAIDRLTGSIRTNPAQPAPPRAPTEPREAAQAASGAA